MAVAKFLFAEKKQSKIFNPVQKLFPIKILVKARFYPSYEKGAEKGRVPAGAQFGLSGHITMNGQILPLVLPSKTQL